MFNINTLANLAMLSLVIGTLPSIKEALKNRNVLKGFSLFGAFGIAIGQAGYFLYFSIIGDYITTILTTPMITYWLIVIIFVIRGKRNG
jgi:hypothetical protein